MSEATKKAEVNNKAAVKKIILKAKANYKAKKDCLLPIFYKGSIVRIDSDKNVELELDHLSYESKVELKRAIKNGHIIVG